MSKSKIEWCDYTVNPVKGLCPMECSYCYARAMYKRFKWDEAIRFDWSVYNELPKIKNPSRIFWGSTMELFGEWVDPEWMRLILEAVKRHPKHTHIFLSKQPKNLQQFSPFPNNAWVGVSATDTASYQDACLGLREVEAKVRFISFEPLLGAIYTQILNPIPPYYNPRGIPFDWVIIGQKTPASSATTPKIEWIKEIVSACDKSRIPVFLKNNLNPLLKWTRDSWGYKVFGDGQLVQEFPNA